MYRNNKYHVMVLFAMLGLVFAPATLRASTTSVMMRSDADQIQRTNNAVEVLTDLIRTPDMGIPRDLLNEAQGIAVIPHVVGAAFGIGGRWGKGLISVREANGRWSPPAFIDLTGGSFGFQIGGEATDLALVFTNRQGVDALLNSKLKLGADASIAAGPVGRAAGASTDWRLKAAVYSYSRTKGLFVGIALDGAVISIDNHANRKVYGSHASARNILVRQTVRPSSVTNPFVAALDRYSPAVASARARK
jgi:lipid-binding SYLF domain-containing protein